MKITRTQLRCLIKEEIEKINEGNPECSKSRTHATATAYIPGAGEYLVCWYVKSGTVIIDRVYKHRGNYLSDHAFDKEEVREAVIDAVNRPSHLNYTKFEFPGGKTWTWLKHAVGDFFDWVKS